MGRSRCEYYDYLSVLLVIMGLVSPFWHVFGGRFRSHGTIGAAKRPYSVPSCSLQVLSRFTDLEFPRDESRQFELVVCYLRQRIADDEDTSPETMSKLGEDDLRAVCELIHPYSDVRIAAVEKFAGKEALLCFAARDQDWKVRLHAVKLLNQLGSPGTIMARLARLGDTVLQVKDAAEQGLMSLPADRFPAEAKRWLLQRVEPDPKTTPFMKRMAIRLLTHIGSSEAVEPLTVLFNDRWEDAGVRVAAADALVTLVPDRADELVPVLVGIFRYQPGKLASSNHRVRAQAAGVLKDIESPEALGALVGYLKEYSEGTEAFKKAEFLVCLAVLEGLQAVAERIQDEETVGVAEALSRDQTVLLQIRLAAGNLKKALPSVLPALLHPTPSHTTLNAML